MHSGDVSYGDDELEVTDMAHKNDDLRIQQDQEVL